AGERHEREVDRVEHQLDAHEHHQRVAPGEEPVDAGAEQHRAEDEVGRGGEGGEDHEATSSPVGTGISSPGLSSSTMVALRWRARVTAPTTAITSRTEVISKASRWSVNSTRPMASVLGSPSTLGAVAPRSPVTVPSTTT